MSQKVPYINETFHLDTYNDFLFAFINLNLFADIINLIKKVPGPYELPLRPNTHFLKSCEVGEDYVVKCMEECWSEQPEHRPDFGVIRSRLKVMKEGK